MSYQWGPQGPAFEYPGCYRTENRFLTLRAAALIVLALALLWVALADPEPSAAALLRAQAEPTVSSLWHVLLALLLLALGGIDLWAAARQRRVLLAPGQPASLAGELPQQSKGSSAGAAWLAQVLDQGRVPPVPAADSLQRRVLALAPQAATAPACLRDYLAVRLAHLLFAAGLLLLLGLAVLVVSEPGARGLAALLCAGLATALVLRSAWISRSAPGLVAMAVTLGVAALAVLGLALVNEPLPLFWRLPPLALPMAAALLLAALLVIEGLGLLAGRVAVDPAPAGGAPSGEVRVDVVAEPERLMQDVERELHAYWTEGIPNRRHAWQTTFGAADAAGARAFTATVLEESQPVLARERPSAAAPDSHPGLRTRRRWLLLLDVLGLLLTLAGGVLWLRLAYLQLHQGQPAWTVAATALVLLVAGGYALRVGHLLWSRLEVDSSLLRLQGRAAAPGQRPGTVALRWSVVRARSVFYAAAEHRVGNRTLLHLVGDEAAARRSVQQVQAYAERHGGAPADERPVPLAAPVAGAPRAPAPAAAPLAPAPAGLAPRFCSACGKPVAAGARFCSYCGQVLAR